MKVQLNSLEECEKCGVYMITNTVNGKLYIGSTRDCFKTRWKTHLKKLRNGTHPNAHLQSAFLKYGDSNFMLTVVEVCDKESVLDREQYYLDYYKSYDREIGYNIEKNVYKADISEETRFKISKTLKDGYASGKIKSHTQFVKGQTAWNKGMTCKSISETRRNMFDSIGVYTLEGVLIVTFRSCIDLVEWTKDSSNILPGIKASAKGGTELMRDKIYKSIREGKSYKGLLFKKEKPLPPEMGVAKWVNSGKAEMPILSRAESTLSEGATTTGGV